MIGISRIWQIVIDKAREEDAAEVTYLLQERAGIRQFAGGFDSVIAERLATRDVIDILRRGEL